MRCQRMFYRIQNGTSSTCMSTPNNHYNNPRKSNNKVDCGDGDDDGRITLLMDDDTSFGLWGFDDVLLSLFLSVATVLYSMLSLKAARRYR